MSMPIRISDEEYRNAKKTARVECRSIQGQVEFWSKIGRCALENPDLPITLIREILSTDWKDNSDVVPFRFKQE